MGLLCGRFARPRHTQRPPPKQDGANASDLTEHFGLLFILREPALEQLMVRAAAPHVANASKAVNSSPNGSAKPRNPATMFPHD